MKIALSVVGGFRCLGWGLTGSIIGHALARSSNRVAAGFFFCDYKNDSTQRLVSILGALVHQLAKQNEQAYVMLEGYYRKLHPEKGLPGSPDPDDLIQVICTMAQLFDQVYLIIDGVDECQGSEGEVVRALCLIAESSDEISMAILSRDEESIREHLLDPKVNFVNIQIAAHREDITEYVTSEVQQRMRTKRLHLEDLSLEGEIVDGLVDGAKGMFRWVACQLDHLEYCMSDEQCPEALCSLPPDLSETYLRILKRIPKARQSYVQLTLDIIAYANPKLSIAQLREILSVPSKESFLKKSGLIREDAITRHCSSLVRKSNDGKYLEFAHSSVQEFLTSGVSMSPEFQMFSISRSRCNKLLAIRCLEYLQLQNFNRLPASTDEHLSDIEETTEGHPLYRYAAINWIRYSREGWDDPALLASARRLFDPLKRPCFTYWAVVLLLELRGWDKMLTRDEKVDLIAEIVDNNFHPLHCAATLSLPEVSSSLLTEIEHRSGEAIIKRALDCAVNCLHGSLELLRYTNPFRGMPNQFQHFMGTETFEDNHTLQTIRIFVKSLRGTPQNTIGLGMKCWAWTFDFSVVQLLVAESKALTQSDLDSISEEMQSLLDEDEAWYIESSTAHSLGLFCECLSRIIDKSALHLELCRIIWRFSLMLVGDIDNVQTYQIDSRVSEDRLSLEKLAKSACCELKVDPLRKAANDTRVDVSSVIYPSTGNTLLHELVLADHARQINAVGVRNWDILINQMFDILLGCGCSLSSRNNNGHTPFSLALEEQKTDLAQKLSLRDEFGSGAWDSPVPILLLLSKSGSEPMLDRLLGLGFRPSPADYLSKTPLHCLQVNPDLSLIIWFEDLLPGSRELRSDGKMPWEYYLEITDFDPPSSKVLNFLIQPFLLDSKALEASRIWSYYTKGFSLHALRTKFQSADRTFTSLIQAGALRNHEEFFSQSGLLCLASVFSVFAEKPRISEFPLTDSTICLLIESTKYWSAFQESLSACQLLKLSASLRYDNAAGELLKRGVDVHRRVGGVSAIEHGCGLPATDEESVSRFQEVLRHTDSAFLNQINRTSGLGLIHLSNPQDRPRYRRKILKITIRSGANPNLRTTTRVESPALVYHLEEGNFDLASVLLEHGADLASLSTDGWSPLHMAAYRNATGFLSKLFLQKNSNRKLNWEIGCRYCRGSEMFSGVRPLHLAAAASPEFLLALLNGKPTINLVATADNGFTAVHFAALGGCQNSVEILVSRGADINAQAVDGTLALHIAVETGNLGLVERLLQLNSHITARVDGMTPLLLAYQGNHKAVIDRLKTYTASSPAAAPPSENMSSAALAKAVASSIRASNLSACQSPLKVKSLVDIDLSYKGFSGLTPLVIAIGLERLPIVKWLLKRGANANCSYREGRSAIQDMISTHSLNQILPAMLDKYLADGGCILRESHGVINLAVDARNNMGLRLLLKHLRTNESCYGERGGVSMCAVVPTAVNLTRNGMTPLHGAIQKHNAKAVELLVSAGADLEARDSSNRTPILLAIERHRSNGPVSSIVTILVQSGSNLKCRDLEGAEPLARACESRNFELICYLLRLGCDVNARNLTGHNILHYLVSRKETAQTHSILPSMFLRLTRSLVDPYETERFGCSALHLSMFRRSMTSFLLNGDFQNMRLAPMPWSTLFMSPGSPDPACLTSGFPLHRRRMSSESFRKLLNMEPNNASNPLCRAAAMGSVETMGNLLSMGSQIDFEGCPEGSALMAACHAGILKSVKFLTRQGASISFQGREKHWSAVEASRKSTQISRWLLIGRFTDQFKLKAPPDESTASTEHFMKWSGITKAEMVILGPWERRPSESSRQYWSRLEQMKQDFFGKVVPPDQGAKTRRQSKLVPSESVRIAAGGYSLTDENGRRLGLSMEVQNFLFWSQFRMCFKL